MVMAGGGRGSPNSRSATYLNLGVIKAKDQMGSCKYLGGPCSNIWTRDASGDELQQIHDHHEYGQRCTQYSKPGVAVAPHLLNWKYYVLYMPNASCIIPKRKC